MRYRKLKAEEYVLHDNWDDDESARLIRAFSEGWKMGYRDGKSTSVTTITLVAHEFDEEDREFLCDFFGEDNGNKLYELGRKKDG